MQHLAPAPRSTPDKQPVRRMVQALALLRSMLAGLVALWAAGAARSQARDAWANLPVPQGVISSLVTSIGKLTVCRDGDYVHVHSAVTRRWHSQWVGAAATLRLTNDWLLVQTPGQWLALAASNGQFQSLLVSPNAQVLNPLGQDNDTLLLVLDGTQLAAFSGFRGEWVLRQVGPNPSHALRRHVAIVGDGLNLLAIDSQRGAWIAQAITQAPQWLSADGSVAAAGDGTSVFAYAAGTGRWSSTAALPGAQLFRSSDWVLFANGQEVLACSGLHGHWERAALGAVQVVAREEHYCLLATAADFVAFSALRGSFSAPLAPNSARAVVGSSVALFAEAAALHGYSPVRQTVATLPQTSLFEEVAGVVGHAQPAHGGAPWCFSALTGSFVQAPAVVQPQPQMTTTGLIWSVPGGLLAWSGRSGNFVPLTGPQLLPIGNAASAVAGAYNDTHFFGWDARNDRWVALPRSTTAPPMVLAWRTAMLVVDGNLLAGFGAQDGRWATTTLPEPLVSARANSESSRVLTANHVLAHAALAEVVSLAQFPEFRRALAAGGTVRCQLAASSSELAVFAFGLPAAQPTPIPGLGQLAIDPAVMATMLRLPDPVRELIELELATPPSPTLIGSEWRCQALLLDSQAQARLTGAAAVMLL